jgi:pilus assembly protein CpaF
MFTIVISEKGGAERRETFEKGEISVGRVQGNDLMLPKGNVSKHHARLLSRDGRFIVTDLKSTNGTYVNGRKTSQATIVREGDKIYIGDFVLRVETGQAGQGTAPADGARADATGPRVPVAGADGPPARPPGPAMTSGAASAVAVPRPAPARAQEPSHYPLEHDPDSESAPELAGAAVPLVPGPPRVPEALGPRVRPPASPTPLRLHAVPDVLGRREDRQQPGRRVALITLVDRVADVVDLSPLERTPEVDATLKEQIERTVRDQAKAMRSEGEAPENLDLDQLAGDAIRELVALGPLGPALDDEEITEIHVARSDWVTVKRKSERMAVPDAFFTSDEAVARVVARLAHQAGEPLAPDESVVERCMPSGAVLVAIGPPASRAWVLTLRKRRRVEASIDDLVRDESMSRPMADFLVACVRARCNMMIVGAASGDASVLLSALASEAPAAERIAVIQGEDEIVVAAGHALSFWPAGREPSVASLAAAASRLGADRLVVGSLGSATGLASLDEIGKREGVLAGYGAPTLRHGLSRLGARLSLSHPGISTATARELVADTFDIGVEVGAGSDGMLRVRRIAELSSADANQFVHDIFLSGEGGAPSFSATGAMPRVFQDFASRGVHLDATVFSRSR